MSRFARKYGGGGSRGPLKHDEVPRDLRHHLWTVVFGALERISGDELAYLSSGGGLEGEWLDRFWTEVLKLPAGSRGAFEPAGLQAWFYEEAAWFQVYDVVEFIASTEMGHNLVRDRAGIDRGEYWSRINAVLEAEQSPWRLVDGELVPISSPADVAAVVEVLESAPRLVRAHIARALDNLSQRPDPNVHGAIAEAIKAVESVAKHVLGRSKGTYGALKQSLVARGAHPSFAHAFDKLYGYTSDEGGLRHGFKPGDDPTKHVAEGRLFVVMASAYVNYLLEVSPALAPATGSTPRP